jgi:hypothetical protein
LFTCEPRNRSSLGAQQRREAVHHFPAQRLMTKPTGAPPTKPAGILICGRPPSPAIQVKACVRSRTLSSSESDVARSGAGPGVVGIASIIPPRSSSESRVEMTRRSGRISAASASVVRAARRATVCSADLRQCVVAYQEVIVATEWRIRHHRHIVLLAPLK